MTSDKQASQDLKPLERQGIDEISTIVTPGFYPKALSGLQPSTGKLTNHGSVTELKRDQSSGRWRTFKAEYKRVTQDHGNVTFLSFCFFISGIGMFLFNPQWYQQDCETSAIATIP